MQRDYIRVAPTSEDPSGRDIPATIGTLHSVWADQSTSLLDRLLPTRASEPEPITYTFTIVSEGEDEPVKMYYDVDDDYLDVLQERLRSIYPSTFHVEEVRADLTAKLIKPQKYSRDEYLNKLDNEELYYDVFQDGYSDMTKVVSEDPPESHLDYPNHEFLPPLQLDGDMLNKNSRFLNGERVAARINRLDRVPDDAPLNTLRRPTVASLTSPPDVATDGAGITISEAQPPGSKTVNAGRLGDAGQKLVESVYARPPLDQLTPVGVQWKASATEAPDWMTSLARYDASVYTSASSEDPEAHEGEPPLTTVIEYLTKARQPLALQIRFSPMADWTRERSDRLDELRDVQSPDGLISEFLGGIFDVVDEQPHEEPHHEPRYDPEEPIEPAEGTPDAQRIEMMDQMDPSRSFLVNMCAFGVLGPDQDTPSPKLEQTLDRLTTAFQGFNGPEYKIVGERLGGGFRGDKEIHNEFENFQDPTVETTKSHFWSDDSVRKDFVLDPSELANFVVVPSTQHLSAEAKRGTRAEQQTQSPLPRPHQGVMRQLRDGLEVGYALNENGHPEDEPVGIPTSSLTKHYVRLAATGGGKSIAAANDQLSLSRNTDGPTFTIDAKGGDFLENYMRAYQAEFGQEALEEDIIYYNFPDELPGVSFFDIRPALAAGRSRVDAVQDVADHFVEVLQIVMGKRRFQEAKNAGNVIRYIIKILFDEEHGHKHGPNRKSADVFGYEDLEWMLEQLDIAAHSDEYSLPETNHEQAKRRVYGRISNTDTFINILEGVKTRIDYIGQDDHLMRLFNNTSPELDFREILDSDKQVLFDLGKLRDSSAEIMTAVLMTTLFDALKTHDMSRKPEDYLVNLQIDEAASVVVSEPMRKFLKEGREFRLSLGLMTQFSKQMEHEGSRGVYMNVLNNVRTTIAGNITLDSELAESFSHEEMDAMEAKHRLRNMANGEWMIDTMNPGWGEGQPQPFSIQAMEIPPGHPESEDPLSEDEESTFEETLASIRSRAANEYGIIDDQDVKSLSVPPVVQEYLGCSEQIDDLLAQAVGGAQLAQSKDTYDANALVSASTVNEKVYDYYVKAAQNSDDDDDDSQGGSHKEHRPPSEETIVETALNRTELIEVESNPEGEAKMRLTEAGQEAIADDTGDVRSAGGEEHDDALEAIKRELTPKGFDVNVLEQDGSEMPDARAHHSDLDNGLILEAETTTPDNPRKVLANLRKAQEARGTPTFIAEAGDENIEPNEAGEDYAYWARRIENIICPPVKRTDDETGAVTFYTAGEPIRIQDRVTALRPVTGDSRRTVWTREDDELVLRDGNENEHARLSDLGEISPNKFPAVDNYDEYNNEHVVYEPNGDQHTYEDKESFREDWVPVKAPLIPKIGLPNPDVTHDDFETIIVSTGSDERAVVYRNGETYPLTKLVDDPLRTGDDSTPSTDRENADHDTSFEEDQAVDNVTEQDESKPAIEDDEAGNHHKSGTEDDSSVSDGSTVEETPDEELGGKDEGVAAFADEHLLVSEGAETPLDEIYDPYKSFAEEHRFEIRNKRQFAPSLRNALDFDFESKRKRVDGSKTTVYLGVALASE